VGTVCLAPVCRILVGLAKYALPHETLPTVPHPFRQQVEIDENGSFQKYLNVFPVKTEITIKSINKFDLLKLIARVYDKKINIIADEQLIIDRSLDSTRFQLATGYVAPEWPELIKQMHAYK